MNRYASTRKIQLPSQADNLEQKWVRPREIRAIRREGAQAFNIVLDTSLGHARVFWFIVVFSTNIVQLLLADSAHEWS